MTTCIRRANSYWTTCACVDCDLDRRRKHKRYSTARPYRIPSDTAWEVLEDRIEQGWTGRAIASACGLPPYYFHSHLADYRRGRKRHLGPNLALMIHNMSRPTEGHVGALVSRRKLQALARIGYSLPILHEETGVKVTTLSMIRSRNERCTAAVANAIADAYDRLHMTPGGNDAAAGFAREQGWPPPLAYDDIDDPDDQPSGARDAQQIDRRSSLLEMVARGDGLTAVTRQLGVTPGALHTWCLRNGLRDTWRTLTDREGDWNSSYRMSREGAA